MSSLVIQPQPRLQESGQIVSVTQARAGWETISLRVVRLSPHQRFEFSQPDEELVLVALGGRMAVSCGDQRWERVGGRQNVFAGMPHALYLPFGTPQLGIEAHGSDCEVAICGARARRSFPAALIEPSSVAVEIRGGENATRQINHILPPDFPADRILVVEVYTPGGNWSSYPPHKHDVHDPPREADLDEIYFYKISRPEGFAVQRIYTSDGRREETITVRNNEAILVPEGYHPVVAAHGYDCYYLNVLAGSARSMAATDDPDHVWVRATWRKQDARLPMVRLEES